MCKLETTRKLIGEHRYLIILGVIIALIVGLMNVDYTEIKEWQTGIGALFGAFFGLIALMIAAERNFELNRLRDEQLRNSEILSVAAALYGEVILLQEDLASTARWTANIETGSKKYQRDFIELMTPKEPVIFPALTHKLGLLPYDLIISISQFYANCAEVKRSLPYLLENKEGVRYSPLTVLKPAVDGVKKIAPALRRIENLVGIPQAEEPDIGHADGVIEMEEMGWEDATKDNG